MEGLRCLAHRAKSYFCDSDGSGIQHSLVRRELATIAFGTDRRVHRPEGAEANGCEASGMSDRVVSANQILLNRMLFTIYAARLIRLFNSQRMEHARFDASSDDVRYAILKGQR